MMMERYPNLKEEVGNSAPDCGISSLPNRIIAKWSIASCALALACWPSISKIKVRNLIIVNIMWHHSLVKL